ncbi:hypothetical protein [Tenacibaculum piscium]|uniref:hypothetical protein n=1 Tax=Tenacibaculum piscium TaxID=1458515 RepID=UPI001EFBE3F5|nr:hypothetical protein [Tenacibaculum piscium]MCG8184223.1 hypothetical protein [Tenacibaculum piscium]MCG8205609.1 hypothetical protein [Tenacibaculum piscium]
MSEYTQVATFKSVRTEKKAKEILVSKGSVRFLTEQVEDNDRVKVPCLIGYDVQGDLVGRVAYGNPFSYDTTPVEEVFYPKDRADYLKIESNYLVSVNGTLTTLSTEDFKLYLIEYNLME